MADQALGDVDLAAIGAVLAEPARARILLALGDGRALPASVLASEAGVAPSTASAHLGRLVEAGLLRAHPQGRHRYYRLAGPEVGELIEALARVSPAAPVHSLRQGTRAEALRAARTCYDHLAGRLGVAVFAALLERRLARGGDGVHRLDGGGRDRLSSVGRDLDYRLTGRSAWPSSASNCPPPAATAPCRCAIAWTGPSSATISRARWAARSPGGCSTSAGCGARIAAELST